MSILLNVKQTTLYVFSLTLFTRRARRMQAEGACWVLKLQLMAFIYCPIGWSHLGGCSDSFLTKSRSTRISTCISLTTCVYFPQFLTYSSRLALASSKLGVYINPIYWGSYRKLPLAITDPL